MARERVAILRKVSDKYPNLVVGHPEAGRKKGVPNKTTTLLKDAILMAASLEGEDGKGKDELVGYLRMVARRFPKSYTHLLSRVLPYHVKADLPEDPLTSAIKRELLARFEQPPMLEFEPDHEREYGHR